MNPRVSVPDRTVGPDIGLPILYRDALMLVIDKPAGLPVHPGPKGGPTLTDHLDALRFGLPLAKRSDDPRSWWMKTDPAGAPSLTLYRVLGRADGLSWLELKPVTGRTHQLRVHCAAMGWPIRGDAIYGSAGRAGPRLQLHARALSLPLYPKRDAIRVEAPAPMHMRAGLEACGMAVVAEAPPLTRPSAT